MAGKKEARAKIEYNRTATSAKVISSRKGRDHTVKYIEFEPDERLNGRIEHGTPTESGKKTRGKKTAVKKPRQ